MRRSRRTIALFVAVALSVTGCGSPGPSRSAAPPSPGTSSGVAAGSATVAPGDQASGSPSPAAGATVARHAFPVVGAASYERVHHDYPATDIIAPCGATAVAASDGTVLEVSRVDSFDPKVDAGATRGGLFVSLLGADGVRYYGSHFASINPGIEAGARVSAGQPIAKVGDTGDSSACHLHFGISPPCAGVGDWWIRRGVIWPWSYLDSWRGGGAKSPAAEITTWRAKNGCPTQPLTS